MKKKKSLTHATHPIPTRKVFKDKKKYDRRNNKKEIERQLHGQNGKTSS
jgi:hypothetical protein